jgi:tRNA pseudouridine38-40 synthase
VSEVFRLRLDLAYVGLDFHGWQIQPDARTVQGELRRCLSRLLGRDAISVAAGRTDAGVHARGQVAHLTVATLEEVERVARALQHMVPHDIEVRRVHRVSPSFNARHSATARRYSYRIIQVRDIFRPHAWYVFRPLDREAMDTAAAAFSGSHDFSSFCKAKSLKKDHNLCDISHCAFDWGDDSAIFHVVANRFLHHMVRNMVGTLVEIGRHERDRDEIPRILAARSRSASGRMAPSQGLFLEEVHYPEQLMDPTFVDPEDPNSGRFSANTPTGDTP